VRVALVQVESPPGEPAGERRERVGELVRGAAGADLVMLPELWEPGYFEFGDYERLAEPWPGGTVTEAAAWARQLGCHVHLGSILERGAEGALHNTAVLIGPSGEVVHAYRKVHVFGYRSREAELLTPGDKVRVARTGLGPVAATTCYDLRFPELYRLLADAGAEIVLVPAAWPAERLSHWRLFTASRAAENQFLLIACNAVGTQRGDVRLGGHSRVLSPWGEVLAEAGEAEGITWADADPAEVGRSRAEFPVLADRRIGGSRAAAVPRARDQISIGGE
jgi:predicted amidohydrolase